MHDEVSRSNRLVGIFIFSERSPLLFVVRNSGRYAETSTKSNDNQRTRTVFHMTWIVVSLKRLVTYAIGVRTPPDCLRPGNAENIRERIVPTTAKRMIYDTFASIHTICTRLMGLTTRTQALATIASHRHHNLPPHGQFFSRSDAGAALAASKKSRHPRPHPRHRRGTPPVVSPTRTPAISVTHVYRSSAGSTNGGPSRAHAMAAAGAAPDPAGDVPAGAGATWQCRGDGHRPKLFCSCAAPVASASRDPRSRSALI